MRLKYYNSDTNEVIDAGEQKLDAPWYDDWLESLVSTDADTIFFYTTETTDIWEATETQTHSEDTMTKVHDALRENGYLPDDIPNVISSFQNRGILFRERA